MKQARWTLAVVLSSCALALLGSAQQAPAAPPAAEPLFGEVHRMLPKGLVNVFGLDLGDLDGDGDVDAYFAHGLDTLLLNDGVGRLVAAAAPLPVGAGTTHAIALGDLDGDGDLDAFLGRMEQNEVLRNLGGATFEVLPGAAPLEFQSAHVIALEDLDGDGDLDAFVGNDGSADQLLLNDGSSHFADASAQLPASLTSTEAVVLGDLDGDGDADAVVGPYRYLYLNTGGGFIDGSAALPASPFLPHALALADVDADGDLDLYLGQRYQGVQAAQDALYVNDGAGNFSDASSQLPSFVSFTLAVSFGDMDDDGDLDAYVAEEVDHLLLNDGAGTFTEGLPGPPHADSRTNAIGLADLDGDDDLDVLLGGGLQSRLYLNRGDAVFTDATHAEAFPALEDRGMDATWFDFEGDGDLDVVVASRVSGGLLAARNAFFENDGHGRFEEQAAGFAPTPTSHVAVASGDVDGDGDVDVLFGHGDFSVGLQNELYLNTGTVQFQPSGGLPAVADRTEAVALADFDEDGDLDVLFGNGDDPDRLLLNDGHALFAESPRLPALGDPTSSLAIGDVNADGHADVVLGSRLFGQNHLLRGDGHAHFLLDLAALPAGITDTHCVRLFDADGDADLDLYAGNGGQDQLLLNSGTGRFGVAPGALPQETEHTRWAELGDVDGDGDPDLVLCLDSSYGGLHRLYANDGAGVFTDQSAWLPASVSESFHVSLVDVDNDDDLDLFYVNDNNSTANDNLPDELFFNRTRQLAWTTYPRLGKSLTLALEGEPGTAWELFFSTGEAFFELPPLGTVRLDPALARAVGSGVLDAQGTASFSRRVPASLSLLGTTVYWQAVLGSPAHLTNLEATTFSDF